ncbi:MAG TPA: PepSY-associated TM helix domain-containing protein [Sphingomonas sp.]|nr:PepSY-associated TM helix domain-containing protein [Sphingomonas sp.]
MSKLAMRRAWFQVHKWLGLVLAILIIPLSLSGAALVWDEGLDRMLNPQRFAVSGDTMLSPDAYVAAAARVLKPGDRIAMLTLPEDDGPVVVAARPATAGKPRPGPPQRTMVYLDPPTARVLEVAAGGAGVLRFLHVLHGSLLVPGVGRMIVGWIGVAMMVSSFTGLWLWWPTVGRWARGLRWKRHRNTDTNLHYLSGFWIALPLFVLSLTGMWISFPQVFAKGGGGAPRGPDRGAMMRAKPLAKPALALDTVLARAGARGRGDVRSVTWPTDLKADWTVAYVGGDGPPRQFAVADGSGAVSVAPMRGAGDPVMMLMRRVHDGKGMGMVWQVIIFVGGILPAVLAVTGIIMWWRARSWKAELAAKQRARRRPVPAE